MHRRWTSGLFALAIGLAAMVGCQEAGVDDGLHQLEQRVRALESEPAKVANGVVAHGVTADVLSLERRLAALEQRVAAVEKASTASVVSGGEMRLDQRRERRARLRQATDEYRARLATIRQTETDPTARQQAVRDALAWYREQRRAILAGEEPAAVPAP